MDAKHCVSLELSKELKANGYPQEGEYGWSDLGVGVDEWKKNDTFSLVKMDYHNFCIKSLSDGKLASQEETKFVAPLASELMERLPELVKVEKLMPLGFICKTPLAKDGDGEFMKFNDTNLCNALAKMWLYLKKNGLLPKEA